MKTHRNFIQNMALGTGAFLLPHLPRGLAEPKKLGIALAGLGNYSNRQIAPALLGTQYCKLTGIVTGSLEKVPVWCKKYNILKQNIPSSKVEMLAVSFVLMDWIMQILKAD